MKFLKSKFFIISVSVVLLLALLTGVLALLGATGPVKAVLGTVAGPFQWCGARAADAVNGFVSVFSDYDDLKKENEELRAQIDELKNEKNDADILRQENEWLKEYLGMADAHPELALTDARIVARESNNYSTVLTLDRGSVHGVKAKMPVVTEDGVFGYVAEAGLDWCRVVSIVETASAVGVYTERTGALGVVEGEADLRGGGVCRMKYIERTADIRVGDRVYTSGSGSLYPSGLLIGEIISISADEGTLSAEIAPSVDFTDVGSISKVMIITGYQGGNKK